MSIRQLHYSLVRAWRQMHPPTPEERRDRKRKRRENQRNTQHKSQPMSSAGNTPQPDTVDSGSGHQPASHEDGKEISVGERRFIAWSELVLAMAIFGAAVAQVVVGKWQWEAMNAQVADQTRATDELIKQGKVFAEQTTLAKSQLEQIRLERRPWLSVAKANYEPFQASQKLRLHIQIRNTGPTPGELTKFKICSVRVDTGPIVFNELNKKLDDFREWMSVNPTIVPPDNFVAPSISLNEIMTPELIADLSKPLDEGGKALFVFCDFHYSGEPGTKYRTQMCFRVKPNTTVLSQDGTYNHME